MRDQFHVTAQENTTAGVRYLFDKFWAATKGQLDSVAVVSACVPNEKFLARKMLVLEQHEIPYAVQRLDDGFVLWVARKGIRA